MPSRPAAAYERGRDGPRRDTSKRATPHGPVGGLSSFVETKARILGYLVGTGLFAGVGVYGTVCNGQFAAFLRKEGALHDIIARDLGFGIKTITISGIGEMPQSEVLTAGGIGPQNSLLFLDAAEVRRKLLTQPIVKEASVTKFYPNRLFISITERVPQALWQKDGVVSIIASDGTNLGERRDGAHDELPFVVGEAANDHIGDYSKILAAAGELMPSIRAGTLVAGRRWDLTMKSNVVVKLPEDDPAAALSTLRAVERSDHVLDRDIISVDLRMPGRVIARLTEEAFAARAALVSKKTIRAKGSQT